MNRNKLNIRMDLLRAAKTAFDVKYPFEDKIAKTFIEKAKEEFENIVPSAIELKNELIKRSTKTH